MGDVNKPREGSLQYWPRKRAKRIYPRVGNWAGLDSTKLLGFVGYKAGMTHIQYLDSTNTSATKGMIVNIPVTVVECPDMNGYSIRFYKNFDYGMRVLGEVFSDKSGIKNKGNEISDFDDVRLVVATQPGLTGTGKKKRELVEIGLSGNKEEKLKICKDLLNKSIKVGDVFKNNQFVDVHGVTKGKGIQGPVKRFGVRIRSHKSEKTRRGPGTLGAWSDGARSWMVAHAGQMGFHTRTEYNKLLVKIGNNPKEANPLGGFLRYGILRNNYLLIKGSLPGSRKRTLVLTEAIRAKKKPQIIDVNYVSLRSKQ